MPAPTWPDLLGTHTAILDLLAAARDAGLPAPADVITAGMSTAPEIGWSCYDRHDGVTARRVVDWIRDRATDTACTAPHESYTGLLVTSVEGRAGAVLLRVGCYAQDACELVEVPVPAGVETVWVLAGEVIDETQLGSDR